MKKIINKLFAGSLLAGMMLVSSCAGDYLDTAPTDSTGATDAVGTTANAMKALNGIAKIMTTQHSYFGGGFAGENNIMIQYESYPSENYNYNVYASGWSPIFNQEFHTRTNSIYDAYAWYYYYTIAGNANTILANIDNAEGTEAERNFVKASALTFRAYAFEKLVHYYCWRWQDSNNGASQGIVLRLDESTDGQGYATLAETYTQIYKDLDEAIMLFEQSGMDRNASQVWMPNINVAHAIYARAALTKQDYTKALTEAKLARQNYPLMSNAEYHAGFCNPTSEWIFGSFGSAQENNWYWSYGTQYACNGYYASTQQTGAGSIGRELINRIPNNDARKALFLTEDKFPGYNFNDGSAMDLGYGILGMGNDAEKADALWEDAAAYCQKMAVSGLEAPYQAGYMHLGGQLKFYVFDTPGVSYLPFIRSSEMVLVEAEANYFLNDETAARASLVELNATSGRNPEYTCDKSGEALWNEIMDYRELELWGEGFAWSDYKRWNRDIVRHSFAEGGNAHISVAKTIPASGVNKWTWDVPLNETDYNDELNLGGK
ncbi:MULTISPECIES: RagB/SusD family nutrient uptake outer membrane protein [Bacteroides]|uniref:RagB/SusD family nutrient uptake outer membrane protein n=1 Tax=Bacteroides muris (ex Fokt et al. 2023) TaxID=2937417 RepID=A0A9X2SX81_9BACE|nr:MULTISPECIES: RagB/SusD family nutrient uptake outer membrane protein [Bacteroides]MCR6510001.1 RagB/SusD family nutrient uptake outer membrane protein [Bacteroides muris (ex Fokt et al. 2023)]NVK93753.1 RagB/SusD family nutrient uptake outer membrane protein [Bacteroides sp. L10-4]